MLAGFTDMIDGTIARKIASFAAIQEGFFIFRCSSAGGMKEFQKTLSEIGSEFLFTIGF